MAGVSWVLLTQDDVLNSDSKLTVLVETWFIGHTHSLLELDIVGAADALWTFMHVQIRANTVTGSVLVVLAN